MKRLFLIIAVACFCISQSEAKFKHIDGYYISKSLDTVKVTFYIPIKKISNKLDYEELQLGVNCYDSINKIRLLTPARANEISFVYSGVRIRMLSRLFDYNPVFLRLIEDGKLKLFKHYTKRIVQGTYRMMMPGDASHSIEGPKRTYTRIIKSMNYVLQKDTEIFFQYNDAHIFKKDLFSKDMIFYLSDCPDLAKKIEQHIYKRKNIEKIVEEYNNSCNK